MVLTVTNDNYTLLLQITPVTILLLPTAAQHFFGNHFHHFILFLKLTDFIDSINFHLEL